MCKLLLGTVVGVFLGAFTMEMLHHKCPRAVKKIEEHASGVASSLRELVHEGQEQADDILVLEP